MKNKMPTIILSLLFIIFLASSCNMCDCKCTYSDGTSNTERMNRDDCESFDNVAGDLGSGNCGCE